MKIDLTKEEWELLYLVCGNIAAFPDDKEKLENGHIALSIFKKLGSEWIDDEYCLKCKNETVACVCMGDGND